MIPDLIAKIRQDDRRALAKAITLLESTLETDRVQALSLLRAVSAQESKSLRIGICGSPGVGKSSFVDVLGCAFIDSGHRVAVLAVDPTSPLSGGSILGDKTRMERLSQSQHAYIRPSPGGGVPGGITANTHEVIQLLEYAGFDIVMLETIGIGQSETDVANLVDTLVYLHQPASGDDLQVIKKGILELSDLFVVTKADGHLKAAAEAAAQHIRAVANDPHTSENKVFCVSSTERTGFSELLSFFMTKFSETTKIKEKRRTQQKNLFLSQVLNDFRQKVARLPGLHLEFENCLKSVGVQKSIRECSQEFLGKALKINV